MTDVLQEWRAARVRRKAFHRSISGLQRSGRYKFVTLTTDEKSSDWSRETLQRHWRALAERMRRRGWHEGYFKVREKSEKGMYHLHVALRTPIEFWPQPIYDAKCEVCLRGFDGVSTHKHRNVLAVWWEELHGASIVDEREIRGIKKAAAYVSKYVAKEGTARAYSYSWSWVWRGFATDWKTLIRLWFVKHKEEPHGESFARLLSLWERLLQSASRPVRFFWDYGFHLLPDELS